MASRKEVPKEVPQYSLPQLSAQRKAPNKQSCFRPKSLAQATLGIAGSNIKGALGFLGSL